MCHKTTILKEFKELEAALGMYSRQKLVFIAEIMGCMSSVVPRARPFVSHLWEHVMPLRMARQPENTGPRHLSSNDGWNTQCIGLGLSCETPAGSSLPLRPGQRHLGGPSLPMLLLLVWETFFTHQSWFLRRIGLRSSERFCAHKGDPAPFPLEISVLFDTG